MNRTMCLIDKSRAYFRCIMETPVEAGDVIGRYITLDSVQREIIGVLRPNIKVPRAAQVYIPLEDLRSDRDYLNREIIRILGARPSQPGRDARAGNGRFE